MNGTEARIHSLAYFGSGDVCGPCCLAFLSNSPAMFSGQQAQRPSRSEIRMPKFLGGPKSEKDPELRKVRATLGITSAIRWMNQLESIFQDC